MRIMIISVFFCSCALNVGGINGMVDAGSEETASVLVHDGSVTGDSQADIREREVSDVPDSSPPRGCVQSECQNSDCSFIKVNHTRSGSGCMGAVCSDATGLAVPPSYCDGKGSCVVHMPVSCTALGGHCVANVCYGMTGENLLGNGFIDGGMQ